MGRELRDGEHHSSSIVSSAVGSPRATHIFLGVDDQLRAIQLAAQALNVTVQMFDLLSRRVGLWAALLWRQGRAVSGTQLLSPTREHR